jgi:hypothetical protein
MIGCFDFIFSVCICLNKMKCQFFIGGKKVGLFAMTEQQHLSFMQLHVRKSKGCHTHTDHVLSKTTSGGGE